MRHARALALLVLAVSCTDRGPPPAPEPRDRPLAQDGSAARAVTSTPDRARVQLDLAAVRAALQIHKGERGAWPPSLDDLAVPGLHYPADLDYDSATGTVRSRTYPGY